MLHLVFKNTNLSATRLGCSRSTLYSWLEGKTPSLKNMMQIKSIFELNIDMQYFYTFFSLLQMMNEMDYEKFLTCLHVSSINNTDKEFLQEVAKQKICKKVDDEK